MESTNATSSPNFISSNHNNHPSPAHSIEYRANREAQTEDVYIYHEDHVFLDNEQDTQSIGASPFIYKMKPTPHKSPSPPEEDTQSIRSSPFIYKMRPTPQKSPSPPQDSQLIQNSPFVAMPTQVFTISFLVFIVLAYTKNITTIYIYMESTTTKFTFYLC